MAKEKSRPKASGRGKLTTDKRKAATSKKKATTRKTAAPKKKAATTKRKTAVPKKKAATAKRKAAVPKKKAATAKRKAAASKKKAATTKRKAAAPKKKAATAKRKAATRKKKAATAKRKRLVIRMSAPAVKPLAVIAVGDSVRLAADQRNLMGRYDPRREHVSREIEGLVCSVREISTGKFVAKSSGDLSGYVVEVVHSASFSAQYSSAANAGGARGAPEVARNPVWARVQAALRATGGRREGLSGPAGKALGDLLNGWRVIKVKAEALIPGE